MKTLADFKRAIHTGMEIELVQFEVRRWSDEAHAYIGEFFDTHIPEKMRGPRYVSHVDTTGFYLKRPDNKALKGSFCGFPRAADLAYRGDRFTITNHGSEFGEYQKRHYKIVIK